MTANSVRCGCENACQAAAFSAAVRPEPLPVGEKPRRPVSGIGLRGSIGAGMGGAGRACVSNSWEGTAVGVGARGSVAAVSGGGSRREYEPLGVSSCSGGGGGIGKLAPGSVALADAGRASIGKRAGWERSEAGCIDATGVTASDITSLLFLDAEIFQ
eukprot:Hpha_TRINITY_DN7726_c0_g1::TRINITY_DN7726_c0_g1_i1::g.85303::m.85303